MYEMERMLLMPRASKQLANVMTCLLSSPITKAKLHKVPPMPYEFWTNILAYKIACWFKVYYSKHKDPAKVLDSIGVEPEFWSLFPDGFSLDGKDFEDLSFKQRVWLLKTVCDTIMHTRKAVQEDIAKQPWLCQFETVLGFDRYGARYIHFPQFLPNDFRIYRHCLDNNVLSTAKLVKSEQESEEAKSFKSNIIAVRLNKCRKGKSQYYNNNDLSNHKSNRQETASKSNDKDLNSFKCNDSAVNSFISEDTNLSSTSTCSNNNVNSNVAKRNRCRSLSKTSDESILSNARSSGYDTTTFSEKSVFDESSQMFKGFANTETDNCSIGIIKEMLNDLKSEIDEEKKANKRESNSDSELESKDNNSTTLSCKSTTNCDVTLTCEKDETKSFWDNLSSSLKTDDEKLKEIIDSGGSKLPENMYLKSLSAVDDFSDSSTITCKSDDEKLSETKNSDSTLSAIENNDRKVTFTRSFCASSSSSESLNKDVTKREHFGKTKILRSVTKAKLNNSEETETVPKRNLRKRTRLRSHYKRIQSEINANKKESKIVNAMKDEGKVLRSDKTDETIKSDIEDSDDSTNNIRYNLQNSNNPKTEERQEHFNKILSDLSVSDFHLVADSVDGLRDLISVFKTRNSETNNADSTKETSTCETKLLEKLIELLNNVESIETIAKDATRKARAKLQREWFNFKEGIVEDQDSSGEGGLSSNWWILGSQGRDPLSTTGDPTLQTLPRSALSASGAQNAQPSSDENKDKDAIKSVDEQSRRDSREASDDRRNDDGNSEKQTEDEVSSGRNQPNKKQEEKQKHKQQDKKSEDASIDEDTEQQTRRVLRARGVSSYTEQLYSDYETDEDELEEWADVEAVYAAPGTQADTSVAHATPKVRHADDWSEQEDSDQDWILPGTRKRKNKRPSANRRLKSFQHKMQTIKENTSQTNAQSNRIVSPDNLKIWNKKTSPPNNPICKIDSVHSELDIKEDPIYESAAETTNYEQNSYDPMNPQQNYYYVIPHNPGISGESQNAPLVQTNTFVQEMTPQVPAQAYYVLPGAQPNYVMQNSSANLLSATEQQPVFQQHQSVYQSQSCSPMMVTQSYVNNVNCMSYGGHVIASVQPSSIAPRSPMINSQNSIPTSKPQNRLLAPQPKLSYPNYPRGAVIRSSNPPVRGACNRPANPRGFVARGMGPRSRMSNPQSVQAAPRQQTPQISITEKSSGQKTTSLIVLSDDDDEIEMIITEKTPPDTASAVEKSTSRKTVDQQSRQKPRITSDITLASSKSIIPPQIIQRMSQGGISITPIKNTPPPQANTNTQLVVVVNETGSHYALALPNGSKLILTPEQVAQIRASNGGKLIL
ncbi:uncharacterized protein LOC109861754 isoform X2 [Pseudomyrmex gracilis]|uniref:uncharacterized protein LOC109861754 isoform X2 n=1 Tax=Pseudomyrmex gracilis TaxID=219809 RepID=UPI00099508B8|nr:uncharacterized protein LOC109861754 isoform X2 [Pseudomyrmex gracilis]